MGKWAAENLDEWIKGSADGRATTRIDDQEAWAGAYQGKYDVERSEGPYTGAPYLMVHDNNPDDYQTAFRDEHDTKEESSKDDDRDER